MIRERGYAELNQPTMEKLHDMKLHGMAARAFVPVRSLAKLP